MYNTVKIGKLINEINAEPRNQPIIDLCWYNGRKKKLLNKI